MDLSALSATDLIIQGGAVGLLALVALMVFLGYLVPLRAVRKLEQDRDYWRAIAMRAMGHAEALIPGAVATADFAKAFTDATGAREEGAP